MEAKIHILFFIYFWERNEKKNLYDEEKICCAGIFCIKIVDIFEL